MSSENVVPAGAPGPVVMTAQAPMPSSVQGVSVGMPSGQQVMMTSTTIDQVEKLSRPKCTAHKIITITIECVAIACALAASVTAFTAEKAPTYLYYSGVKGKDFLGTMVAGLLGSAFGTVSMCLSCTGCCANCQGNCCGYCCGAGELRKTEFFACFCSLLTYNRPCWFPRLWNDSQHDWHDHTPCCSSGCSTGLRGRLG